MAISKKNRELTQALIDNISPVNLQNRKFRKRKSKLDHLILTIVEKKQAGWTYKKIAEHLQKTKMVKTVSTSAVFRIHKKFLGVS